MDLRKIGWEGVEWMRLSEDREEEQQALVKMVMNLQVP
jgi:hypothetical protein